MNDKGKKPVTIEGIIEAVKEYQPHADIDLIQRAYELAESAHRGQTRVSGEAYIIHQRNIQRFCIIQDPEFFRIPLFI